MVSIKSPSAGSDPQDSGHSKWPAGRSELLVLAVVLLIAGVLRFAFPASVAVEHFDEGVYASNVWFSDKDPSAYPYRHLFGPPLVPGMLELCISILGPTNPALLLPGAVFGTLTVLMVWVAARSWFGPAAAIAAGIAAAISDYHVIYSRTSLTEPVLGFWLLAGIFLATKAIPTGRFRIAVIAGIACGIAWWTKYNGWLTLAITGAALPLWLVLIRPDRRVAIRAVACWFVMAVTAFIVWLPVLWGLRNVGGYAAVAANHQGYLLGAGQWLHSLRVHVASQRILEGWLSCLSPSVALVTCGLWMLLSGFRFTWNDTTSGSPVLTEGSAVSRSGAGANGLEEDSHSRGAYAIRLSATAVLLALAAAGAGSSTTLGALAAAGIALHLAGLKASRAATAAPIPKPDSAASDFPRIVIFVWFVSLCFATPLYQPYPRLALPWLMSAWLGAGMCVAWWCGATRAVVSRLAPAARRQRNLQSVATAVALILVLMVVDDGRLAARGVPGWAPRTGVQRVARSIRDHCIEQEGGSRNQYVVYTFGEPAVFFHLRAIGVRAAPIADLGFVNRVSTTRINRVWLVTGDHAETTPSFQRDWPEFRSAFEEVASWEYQPALFVLLNHHSPAQLASTPESRHLSIRLWRLRQANPRTGQVAESGVSRDAAKPSHRNR